MSDISSAGITRGTPGYGKTCRKDVLGGVEVPVMPGAAAGARPAACPRLSSASRYPHAEQVFELGYHLSSTTSSRPARWHLYSSWRRNSPHPQSEIARASRRLRTIPATFRSSITIVSAERTRRVLARCRKSRRALRTLRWARATLAAALARFADPFRQRARRRW